MIFAIRQLQAKCLEQRQDLYLLFIDPTKAFDTISRPGLWSILSKLGCPPKFISMVRSLHDGMMARVIENGDVSDPFPVTNGVKQGCVLAPTLFSLHAVCWNIVCGARQDQCWHHDPLQKWRPLLWSAATESQHQSARSSGPRLPVFADDYALAAHSEEDLQCLADCFSTTAKAFGLTISIN